MGADDYWYFVPYDPDVQRALEGLRQREFAAGRYSPVVRDPMRDRGPFQPAHGTIAEAVDEAARSGEGTRSILDIDHVSERQSPGVAVALPTDAIVDIFDTERPTRTAVEAQLGDIFHYIDRGECVYLVTYEGDRPTDILFAGYSYD
jgi:hypothetical protein